MRSGVQTVDQNLRQAMRFFGEATPAGEVSVAGGAQLVYSGLDYGVFNIALLTQPVSTERELAAILSACGRFYRQRKARWSFWLCEDLLEPALRRNREVFAEAGMRVISQAPGMVANAIGPASRPLPQIECRPVADAASRSLFTGLTVTCFDIPFAVGRAIYDQEAAWQGSYRGFLGIVDGVAVSIVALVRSPEALGIYSLGTLPEYRNRGFGEALLRAALAMDRAGSTEPLVLESTEAGYSLYRRLGFRDVTSFTVYLTR